MATEFSRLLEEARAEAGFKSAFDFYNKSGGKRVLRISFQAYWKMEQGKLLPKARRLGLLVASFKLFPESSDTERLLRAYLKTLVGDESAFDWIMGRLETAWRVPSMPSLESRAVDQLIRQKSYHYSMDQARAIYATYANYWISMVLANDARP